MNKQNASFSRAGLSIVGFGLGLLAYVGVVEAAPKNYSSPNQCLPPSGAKQKDSVLSCSSIPKPKGGGKIGKRGAPQSRLKATKRKSTKKKLGLTKPGIELDLATRQNRKKVRARAWSYLQREVSVLRRLTQNTPKTNKKRPAILLRLAETYFEMQLALNEKVRSYDDPIYKARKNKRKVKDLRSKQARAKKQLDAVRKATIKTYATLVQDHPDFRDMDQVLFSLAFAFEELGQFDKARQVYFRLIRKYPKSDYIPHAWLSFAEYYFNQGEMQGSLKFYKKVTAVPPDRNPVYGFALYKSAWAYYNISNFKESLRKFAEVIEFVKKYPDTRDAKNLGRQSRRELVLPYASVGKPKDALNFFRRYAKNNDQAMEMLESLADVYFDTGKWDASVQTYQTLITQNPKSDKVCYWQTRVTNAVISSKPKAQQVEQIRELVQSYERYSKGGKKKTKAILQCKQETASTLVWLATTWHRETVGSPDQPGTNDKATMALAARLYEIVKTKFPGIDNMKFPLMDKRDWPTLYRISYYHAELLWKMKDWTACGPAFDKVVQLNPKGEYTQDAAYAAVLCYNNLYQQRYQAREKQVRREEDRKKGKKGKKKEGDKPATAKLKSRPFTPVEKGMLGAFQRYVCYVPDSDELPTIKYRRARIYYEANRFEEAAQLFKDIAWNHKKSDLSVFAANLYLDSLNMMATRVEKPKAACLTEMSASLDPLSKMYCTGADAAEENADLCSVVGQLRCDVLRKEAEVRESQKDFKEAGRIYVRIAKKFPQCGARDEMLYNAAIDFEAARLLGRAVQVRKALVQNFPNSSLAKKSIFLLGANYHALAFYEQAAKYYEEFATKFPGEDGKSCSKKEISSNSCPIAKEALMNAVFFRIGLGNIEKAIEDVKLFEKNFASKAKFEAAKVSFSVGSMYKQRKQWNRMVDYYRAFLRKYRRNALPSQTIRANVEMGKSFWVREDKRRAGEYFKEANKAWRGGKAVSALKKARLGDEQEKIIFEAKDAASEAMFYLAEYKYDAFRAIKFPRYKGGKSLSRVNTWAKKEFGPWVEKKRKALKAAESEYNKIAAIEVPRWQIAAAARIGEMYRSFVDEFRDAPIPKEIEADPELFDIYVGALDEQSEPFQKAAIDKFEFCIITSTKVRWFSKFSRQCEQELNRLNPREYPAAAELRGTPSNAFRTKGKPGVVELERTAAQ